MEVPICTSDFGGYITRCHLLAPRVVPRQDPCSELQRRITEPSQVSESSPGTGDAGSRMSRDRGIWILLLVD